MKDPMKMTDQEFDEFIKNATVEDLEKSIIKELEDPKSPMKKFVCTKNHSH